MKAVHLLLLAFCLASPWAAAEPQNSAQNAIGFVKLQLDAGSMYLARNDFLSTEGDAFTIPTLIRDQLPPLAVVHIWDQWADTGGYLSATNLPDVGWLGIGTEVELLPGVGFWIDLSNADIDGGPWSLCMFGEVPGANNERETTAFHNLEVDLVGYPYPAEVDLFTDTDLARRAPAAAVIHRWDADAGEYRSATKQSGGEWDGPAIEMGLLRQCEGFWIDVSESDPESAAVSPDETKPYDWP